MTSYDFEQLVFKTKKNLLPGEFDLNMRSLAHVGRRIASAINSNEKVIIYGDYDVDGIATSAMLKSFINDIASHIGRNPSVDITISTRYSSGYGMSTEKVDELTKKYDLIIGVDHGANSDFLEKFDNSDSKMVVFDHHKSENSYDFIVNPATDGITGISSGIVVKKFIDYFIDKTKININPVVYSDMEALTIISDMADMNNYTRARLEEGMAQINKKKRFAFKEYPGNITHKDLSFGVISRINAVGRMEDNVDFVTQWLNENKNYEIWKELSIKIDAINNKKKSLVNKYFNKFLLQAEAEKDLGNTLRLYVADAIPIGLNGLIAQRLFQYNNKESIVLSLHNGKYEGSGRGYDIYNTLDRIQEAMRSDVFDFGGHHAALGLKVPKKSLDIFSYHVLHVESKNQKEIKILDAINVTDLIAFSELLSKATDQIPLNQKFWFSLEDYNFMDIKRFKSNFASIQLGDDNKLTKVFVNLDLVSENHLRSGKPLKVAIDELYSDSTQHSFSIEAALPHAYSVPPRNNEKTMTKQDLQL